MVIGLTGRVGSGKSFVAEILVSRFSVVHVDLDVLGHEVVAELGLDRAALRERVFSEPGALLELNRLVHPVMKERVLACIHDVSLPVILNGAVLDEIGLLEVCDLVWVVDADDAVIRARIGEKFDRISPFQKSRDAFLALAELVFSTGPDIALEDSVVAAFEYFVVRSGHG